MKKSILIFLVLFLLFGKGIATYAITSDVKEGLTLYFSNELEQKKELKEIKNPMILKGSRLEVYDENYSRFILSVYKGREISLEEYSLEVKINSVEETFDGFKVDVDKNVTLKYSGNLEKSRYTDNHIIYFKKIDENIYVEADIYEKGEVAKNIEGEIKKNYRGENREIEYINEKIDFLKEREKNLREELEKIKVGFLEKKEEESNRVEYGKKYDGKKAAKWAIENAYKKPDYKNDCTNFVSKALNAGGLTQDRIWYNGSNAWIRVNELRDYLIRKNLATESKTMENVKVGDIIQLRKIGINNRWGWQHSLIVTDINKEGQIFVSARTNAAQNVGLFEYYPSTRWEEFRVLHIK